MAGKADCTTGKRQVALQVKLISANELRNKLDKKEVILVDVRGLEEYKLEYIDGSFLIPLAGVSIAELPKTSLDVVVHCHSGKRSEVACQKLSSQNPSLKVYNLEGGIVAWKEAGYPVRRVA